MAEANGGQMMPRGKKKQSVEIGRGKAMSEAVKKSGVTEQTYHRWRRKCGGLRIGQAQRLKEREKGNARLKELVADTDLDKAIRRASAVVRPLDNAANY